MNYYIGIITNNKTITSFHLIDKNEKRFYRGISKIKNFSIKQEKEFISNIKKYEYLLPISQEQFNFISELSFYNIEQLHIKNFLKQYSLEEYLI